MIVNWFDALAREIDSVETYIEGEDHFEGFGVSKAESHLHRNQMASHWFVVEPGGARWNIGEVKPPEWDEDLYQRIKNQIQEHLTEMFREMGLRE